MWRAGPPHGCDAALTPRGRAVGGPRGVQEAQRRGHVAGGHTSTQIHVGDRVGRHVAGRDGN